MVIMDVEPYRGAVRGPQSFRREDFLGRAEKRGSVARRQTEHEIGVLIDDRQFVRDEQQGHALGPLQTPDQGIQTFLAGFIDSGGRLVEQENGGPPHQGEGEEEALELAPGHR
ncbi:MAG TPA: hypothetical protein VH833_02070, partial [Gemmatimonadales bacterium]